MGIRVTCPNGHVLNVKSHLAGKKGRCPSCEAIFEVPSGSADEELDADAPRTAFDQIDIEQLTRESAQSGSRPVGVPRPRPENRGGASGEGSVSVAVVDDPAREPGKSSGGNSPPAEITSDPSAVWYVRRASGEQYGPAQSMMFWQWVQEGRVPEDSHVWKQGWPEWKSAREWLARKSAGMQQPAPAASQPAPVRNMGPVTSPSTGSSMEISILPSRSTPQPLPSAISPVASTAARHVRRRKNSDMSAAVIIVLLLLFLASLTGAIIVVYQSMQ